MATPVPYKFTTSSTSIIQPTWQSYITLDLLVYCAKATVLQPFFAWMLPLSLRAITVPYSHPSFQLTALYASFLTLLWVLDACSKRYAYGSARKVNLQEEIVLITGGVSGLGKSLVDFYRMKGTTVVVLDIKVNLLEEEDGVEYYQCDVGNSATVRSVIERVKKEIGIPTILINNAAVMNGKSILELTDDDLATNFSTNVLSSWYTTRALLPLMLAEGRGTIVTVASVLGYLGCSHLSDYCASKAALIGFHSSLNAELSRSSHVNAKNIKTILVAPGQIVTNMFKNVKTPSSFLSPVIEPVALAKEIVQMINSGEGGEIRQPFYTQFIPVLAAFPVGLQRIAHKISGMDKAMEDSVKVKDQ